MQAERIFNIFVYFDGGVATEYGVRHHNLRGSDQQKIVFLKTRVDQDHSIARRFNFTRSFTPEEWLSVSRYGSNLEYFEEALTLFRAPASLMFCATTIVDGVPIVEMQIGPNPYRGDALKSNEKSASIPDYLVMYTAVNAFRFTELINDDYFKAIRLLFNAKLYVSCSKLLMSCVDTLAFVEFGDVAGNFTKWLDTYVDLAAHGITADELWEFRNSLLHMTNLSSRKVMAGKISPLMPFVGQPNHLPPIDENGMKPFNLAGLIKTIGNGIGKWGETYNSDSDKIIKFIERYDTTISDSRLAWVHFDRN